MRNQDQDEPGSMAEKSVKNTREEIEVFSKRPKVVQLNKSLIIGFVGIILLIFILIIVNSYSRQIKNSHAENSPGPRALIVSQEDRQPDQALLSKLPAGYSDASEVEAILKRSELASTATISPEFQEELASLRQEQSALLAQVNTLKANASNQNSSSENTELNGEAQHSSIFFAGAAPILNANNATPTGNNNENSKKSANADKSSSAPMHFPNEYESQNMQPQKMDFLDSKPSKDIYNQNTVQYPASKFIIQAGSVIPAVLQTQIVSSLPGMVTAIVSENVYDSITGQYLIIPKGTKLLGQYNSQISYGQNELQAKFVRLIRPDGSSVVLGEGTAGVDRKGVSGFEDTVDNHWGSIIGSAVLMTIFNIPAIVATNQMNNNCTDSNTSGCTTSMGSTASASALQSVGQSASQVGSALTTKSLNVQPTITIHPGYQFSVMVTKDTILPPYHTPMQVIPEISQ
jgi:type IV secretion system protein VirB10